jgi:hypothetical protein
VRARGARPHADRPLRVAREELLGSRPDSESDSTGGSTWQGGSTGTTTARAERPAPRRPGSWTRTASSRERSFRRAASSERPTRPGSPRRPPG